MPDSRHERRRKCIERALRTATGLEACQGLHPAPQAFYQQQDALSTYGQLLRDDEYKQCQLGVFAKETSEGGKRRFLVDTFAGFALQHEQRCTDDAAAANQHLYEVILEDRPCWLYFDLEFSRDTNRELDPLEVMAAFHETFAGFCTDVLGGQLDETGLFELDSSTPKKFSRHLIVKSILPPKPPPAASPCAATGANSDLKTKPVKSEFVVPSQDSPVQLAFANNAQIGIIVREFISYAHTRRHLPESKADLLWMRSPPSAARPPGEERDAMLIDSGVYSRNRCFRLLSQSKFGKKAMLQPMPGSHLAKMHPSMQFLSTMSSFVPVDTPHFRHPLIPAGYGHAAMPGIKIRPDSAAGYSQRAVPGAKAAGGQSRLTRFVAEMWDNMRRDNEKGVASQSSHRAVVTSMYEINSQFFTVTLGNNNFCFGKGSSHRANHIYLVVDRNSRAFRQKCYDPDCRHYGSPWFPIPAWFWETSDEEDDLLANLELPQPGAREPDTEDAGAPGPESQDAPPPSTTDALSQAGKLSCPDKGSCSSSSSSSSQSSSSSSSLSSNSRCPSLNREPEHKRARLHDAE